MGSAGYERRLRGPATGGPGSKAQTAEMPVLADQVPSTTTTDDDRDQPHDYHDDYGITRNISALIILGARGVLEAFRVCQNSKVHLWGVML